MTLRNLFLDGLSDLYSIEQQMLKALPVMAKAAVSAELAKTFTKHLKETEKHLERVNESFTSLNTKPTTILSTELQASFASASKRIKRHAGDVCGDLLLIGFAQRIEHLEIAAYSAAISLAKTLSYADAANLLVENLQNELRASNKLTKLSKPLLKRVAAIEKEAA